MSLYKSSYFRQCARDESPDQMDVPPAIALIAVVSLAAFLSPVAAHRNGSSLSSERVQVYADLIDSFTRTGFKLLSSKTFPLNLSVVANDAVCLQGVHLESTDESALTYLARKSCGVARPVSSTRRTNRRL
jgi:hypothetical protein